MKNWVERKGCEQRVQEVKAQELARQEGVVWWQEGRASLWVDRGAAHASTGRQRTSTTDLSSATTATLRCASAGHTVSPETSVDTADGKCLAGGGGHRGVVVWWYVVRRR